MLYLDPAWLREEYLTWHRSLDNIAAQLGCPIQTLNRFAREHSIPVRPRGTKVFSAPSTAPGCHPSDLPEPLRHILTGRSPQRRLRRLLVVAGHASINQAAQALGIWPSSLYTQLASLERACGGPLIRRSPRPPGTAALTPLGQLLCQQASEYLGLQRTPGPPAVRDTAAGQAAAPARPVRVAQAQVRGDAERAMVSSQ